MIEILTNALNQVKTLCVEGIEPNVDICQEYAEKSMGLATALSPYIGYSQAARVAKRSLIEGKSLIEIVLEERLLTEEEVQKVLDPKKMTEPNL